MHKNTISPALIHRYKPEAALFAIAVMLGGLLGSRSLGSIGIILFGANALRGIRPKEWLKQRWWLFGLIWLALFAATFFWSTDKGEWNTLVQVKLPFLLLPLSFSFLPRFTQWHIHLFTLLLFGCMMAGCMWSAGHLLKHAAYYFEGYGTSRLLPTPAYNDHISFSCAIAFCVAWGMYQWQYWQGFARWLGGAAILLFIVYLHLLAAKTGLVCLYVFIFGWLIYLLLRKDWKKVGMAVLCIALLVTAAYNLLPTFRTRIGYIFYAADRYKEGNRTGDYGDIGRVISYNIAGKTILQHPIAGVGAGDMLQAMDSGYAQWYPHVAKNDHLLPHNEFLTLALGAGISCALFFIVWLLLPLRKLRRNRGSAFFLLTWCMLLVPLMVDPFLEVQWGVLVYLLPLLWCRKVMLPEPPQKPC